MNQRNTVSIFLIFQHIKIVTKYNLDYLGIGDLTREQLLSYLYTGEMPEYKTMASASRRQ